MKMYLGSYIDLYCVCCLFVLLLLTLSFSIIVLMSEISFATLFILIMCIGTLLIYGYLFVRLNNQFLLWGVFNEKGIVVKTIFKKSVCFEYSKCKDIGLAYYVHHLWYSSVGSKVKYIYLSYDIVDKKYLKQINKLKNNERFIKIRFCPKAYRYLKENMPYKQKSMLNDTGAGSVC